MASETIQVETLKAILDSPGSAGLFTDFDGTLAEIVTDPDTARPVDGAVEVLTELAGSLACVGVLSGRPVSFLEKFFPQPIVLGGLYGLEVSIGGVRRDHPLGGSWREVIDDVAAMSVARGPAGMRVEPKGLSLTLHYRERPELESEVEAWAALQAHRSGLQRRAARMSFELHPPIPADKGSALGDLAEELTTVCFVGDDVADLRAFDALDGMAAQGRRTVRVAVHSSEETGELMDRADVVVDGPKGVLGLLTSLAADLS